MASNKRNTEKKFPFRVVSEFGVAFSLILAGLLVNAGCSDTTTEPPPPTGLASIELISAEYESVTVRVTSEGFSDGYELRLLLSDSVWTEGIQIPCDTLLVIPGLLPSTDYFAVVEVLAESSVKFRSEPVILRTKNPLSTDYELRAFECGVDRGNLNDALYLSRDDIWAVGTYTMWNDSAGKYLDYNAVHWDGTEVKYYRIPFYLYIFGKEVHLDDCQITQVQYYRERVWFFTGAKGVVTFQNGRFQALRFEKEDDSPGSVASTWADNAVLYVGTHDGKIMRLEGDKFIDVAETNIRGIFSLHAHRDTLYAMAGTGATGQEVSIFRIANGVCAKADDMTPPRGASGMWISDEGRIYISGPGIHFWDGETWVRMTIPKNWYFHALSAFAEDRIFATNSSSMVMHFNGWRWNMIQEAESFGGIFYNIKAGPDGFCAVGRNNRDYPMFLIGIHR